MEVLPGGRAGDEGARYILFGDPVDLPLHAGAVDAGLGVESRGAGLLDWAHVPGFDGARGTGVIWSGQPDDQKMEAYQSDITYATNNELGFDYLRDNMKPSLDQVFQKQHNFAIVDEVDSILIDEARTPLIISGPAEDRSDLYTAIDKMIPFLSEEHYELDEKTRGVTFTEEGNDFLEQKLIEHGLLAEGASLYDPESTTVVHHVNQALRAHKLFQRDKDYIVRDGEVMLIDEFTGRMMAGRRLSEGLHQAIEAKEEVTIQPENTTLASVTFQNYFRLYDKLSGMTGTALTEAEEFMEIYGLGVVEVPTNKPIARVDEDDQVYRTALEKYQAMIKEAKRAHEKGQPVLLGTTSIEKSELLSQLLQQEGVPHNVLNARHHEQEAQIVADAGRLGAVTIATNMAGRGTDIQLGGNVEMKVLEALAANPEADPVALRAEEEAKHAEEKQKVIAFLGEEKIPVGTEHTGIYNANNAYGTVDDAITYIERLIAAGADEILFLHQMGTVPHWAIMETIKNIGEKIIPHFREKYGEGKVKVHQSLRASAA